MVYFTAMCFMQPWRALPEVAEDGGQLCFQVALNLNVFLYSVPPRPTWRNINGRLQHDTVRLAYFVSDIFAVEN